jgi:hypothetical protein
MNNNFNYDNNIENSRNNSAKNMNSNKNPYIAQNSNNNGMFSQGQNQGQGNNNFGFNNGDFLKGALIGAAVTFLLTNKGAQETLMKAASKGNELFQAGMEELKERYEDAKAQMDANKE